MGKKRKPHVKKGKKKHGKSKTSKKWEKYKIEGDKLSKSKICPKCGPGVFMAEHKDRWVCGKCGYTEWKSQ